MKLVSFRKRNVIFRGRPTGQQVNDVYLDAQLHTPAVGEMQLWSVMKAIARANGAKVAADEL